MYEWRTSTLVHGSWLGIPVYLYWCKPLGLCGVGLVLSQHKQVTVLSFKTSLYNYVNSKGISSFITIDVQWKKCKNCLHIYCFPFSFLFFFYFLFPFLSFLFSFPSFFFFKFFLFFLFFWHVEHTSRVRDKDLFIFGVPKEKYMMTTQSSRFRLLP